MKLAVVTVVLIYIVAQHFALFGIRPQLTGTVCSLRVVSV